MPSVAKKVKNKRFLTSKTTLDRVFYMLQKNKIPYFLRGTRITWSLFIEIDPRPEKIQQVNENDAK